MAKNYKTIALTGTEQKVALAGQNCDIRNDSVDIVYASAEAGITSGADGVLSIPAGQAAKLLDCRGTLYILGTGSVMLCGNDYSELVFKTAATSSGEGGGTVDDVARQAISSHANNADIHVTAAEKTAWNNKAELSDIPTSLPADGGNADTVDGLHAIDIVKQLNVLQTVGFVNNSSHRDNYECVIDSDTANSIGLDGSDVCWWHIKYFKNVNTDGYGVQIAIPLLPHPYADQIPKYRTSVGDAFQTWQNLSDGGNAASLNGKTADDFVLKSEYDALAARVAALEGTNNG